MSQRIISIYKNDTDASRDMEALLRTKLEASGFVPKEGYVEEAELLFVIGGDGTLLEAIHCYDFPDVPIIGINTGHLGFFQELHPDDLDQFMVNYSQEHYALQRLSTVQATVHVEGKDVVHKGLNEIVIRGSHSATAHLNISIGGSFIEKFSGDGILIATPSGSTAYNYSIGGSIVDPRIDLLQVTPIAPMNTTAYRSFTSSVLLPSDMQLGVVPEYVKSPRETLIQFDGNEVAYEDVDRVTVEYSDTIVQLMRLAPYDFWNKVKTKFL